MSEPGFRTDPVFIANINLPGFRVFQGCGLGQIGFITNFSSPDCLLAVGDFGKRAVAHGNAHSIKMNDQLMAMAEDNARDNSGL
ncbi:hypothetical protein CEXT_165121 [Caerostris extrusa]|uniref:Uncharacterized protein n=1 Tax=Caerostris extrusa TaxID=172846 RepID=A0AAV4XS47_CAEEX|nr:hypothetical protein CEXT_165121 [Caerostris extrusa]